LIFILAVPAVAQHAETPAHGAPEPGDVAHGAEKTAQKQVHPDEAHGDDTSHAPKTYFGIPGWVLKLINMFLFIGFLVYLLRGPIGKAFAARGEEIRKAAEEARIRREKADQVASDIQARLAQIEREVQQIRERATVEGEKQKRELMTAAETESQKIVQAARNEIENRLKHARRELTEYAGQLSAERAEQILKQNITEADQRRLFEQSLNDVREVQG
jgi:F-type H+-transporting ATPase subunit b